MLRQVLSDLNVVEGEFRIFPAIELKKRLAEKSGFGTIYFTLHGKLYGYISLRNLAKDAAQLPVKKVNHMVRDWDYSMAKEKFASNKDLDTLPVVDDKGNLIGEYVSSSLLEFVEIYKDYLKWMGESGYKDARFLAVLPQSDTKRKALGKILDGFSKYRISFEVCEWDKIRIFGRSFVVLLADWVEGFCADYVFENPIADMKILSYRNLLEYLRGIHRKAAFIDSLDGLKVYSFNFWFNQKDIEETDYIKNYKKEMLKRKKMCDPGVTGGLLVPPELKEKFFDELYATEYWKTFNTKVSRQHKKNGITWLVDMETPWVNIENGSRRVLYWGGGTPSIKCWFFGSCVFVGSRVEDKNTIESMVQKKIRQAGLKCQVMNRSAWEDATGRMWKIVNTKFHVGDVIVIHEIGGLPGAEEINPVKIAYEHNMPLDWFTDQMPHANHHAISIWSQAIFDKIYKEISVPPPCTSTDILPRKKYIERYYIDTFIFHEKLKKSHEIGAIVMNCNPFTKGHRYLIEQAKQQVDKLIVFVVEEDKSYFSFEDRFAMVCDGTSDLDGVEVVPSGDFILSASTFPEYFIKMQDEDIVKNVEYDITLFAECIANPLNIKYRFVGEELSDPVTAEYNKAMHRILPKYGVQVIEIPRIQKEGIAISASEVRRRLGKGNIDELESLIPVSTMQYLGYA